METTTLLGVAVLWIAALSTIVRVCVSIASRATAPSASSKIALALGSAFLLGPGIASFRDWGGLAPPVVTAAMGAMGYGWVSDILLVNVTCWVVTSAIVFALMPSARSLRGVEP